MDESVPESEETRRLLARLDRGDDQAFSQLFSRHRKALHQAIELRIDPQLRSRVDASDVVQETQLEAYRRLNDYLSRRPMPFRLWLRKTAQERLIDLRRKHVQADRRAVGREVSLPDQSTLQLAGQLLANLPSPSQRAVRNEIAGRVRQAITRLPEADREVLLMRSFEGLTNQETACILGIEPATASKRLGRAVRRLRDSLVDGGMTESQL